MRRSWKNGAIHPLFHYVLIAWCSLSTRDKFIFTPFLSASQRFDASQFWVSFFVFEVRNWKGSKGRSKHMSTGQKIWPTWALWKQFEFEQREDRTFRVTRLYDQSDENLKPGFFTIDTPFPSPAPPAPNINTLSLPQLAVRHFYDDDYHHDVSFSSSFLWLILVLLFDFFSWKSFQVLKCGVCRFHLLYPSFRHFALYYYTLHFSPVKFDNSKKWIAAFSCNWNVTVTTDNYTHF